MADFAKVGLTQTVKGGGCASKLAPGLLAEVLSRLPKPRALAVSPVACTEKVSPVALLKINGLPAVAWLTVMPAVFKAVFAATCAWR